MEKTETQTYTRTRAVIEFRQHNFQLNLILVESNSILFHTHTHKIHIYSLFIRNTNLPNIFLMPTIFVHRRAFKCLFWISVFFLPTLSLSLSVCASINRNKKLAHIHTDQNKQRMKRKWKWGKENANRIWGEERNANAKRSYRFHGNKFKFKFSTTMINRSVWLEEQHMQYQIWPASIGIERKNRKATTTAALKLSGPVDFYGARHLHIHMWMRSSAEVINERKCVLEATHTQLTTVALSTVALHDGCARCAVGGLLYISLCICMACMKMLLVKCWIQFQIIVLSALWMWMLLCYRTDTTRYPQQQQQQRCQSI